MNFINSNFKNANLNFLKYFYDAARLGSITDAAELNHVSRPAISQAIHRLEESIGLRLTQHTKRQLLLTEHGHIAAKHCETIFQEVAQLGINLESPQKDYAGEMSIALSQSLEFYIRPIVRHHHQISSSKLLTLKIATTPEISRAVLNKESLVGVTLDDGGLENLIKETIEVGEFILVGFNKEQINQGIICTEDRKEVRQLKREYAKKFEAPMPINIQINSWSMAMKFAEDGLGLAFVPDFLLKAQQRKTRMKLRKISLGLPRISYKIVLLKHPLYKNHPGVKFLEALILKKSNSKS